MTLVDNYQGERFFAAPSHSNPNVTYDLRLINQTGDLRCNCPDAQCRGKVGHLLDGGGCKHCRALRSVIK